MEFHENEKTQQNKNANSLKNGNSKQVTDYTIHLENPHLDQLERDILHHFGFDTDVHDLKKMFGDVKFVCMGGPQKRMKNFALYIMREIAHNLPTGTELSDLTQHAYRYSMYKVGPVLSVNHGMGAPSMNILLQELIKLLYYAGCTDPIFFRIGSSGGIGIPPGSVVVSNHVINGMGNSYYEIPVLGELVRKPCILNKELVVDLKSLSDVNDEYEVVVGTTMSTLDFHECQARLDGIFCSYTEADKMKFLNNLYQRGVRNIEMEALALSAITHQAGIRAAVVCCAFVDRLKGDQICVSREVHAQWEKRPQEIVARYIKKCLNNVINGEN